MTTQAQLDLAFQKIDELPSCHGDMVRIVAAAESLGLKLTTHQADEIWSAWSSYLFASWIILEEDDVKLKVEVQKAVEHFVASCELRLVSLDEVTCTPAG
jgi:hypothetical protein